MRMFMSVLLLCACSKGGSQPAKHDEQPHREAPAIVKPDAQAEAPEPAVPEHGVPGSAVESISQKNWPCRFVLVDDDVAISTTFEYGPLKKCWVPVDLAGRSGIVGCPVKSTEMNLDNKVQITTQYEYSDAGLLIGVHTDMAVRSYDWDGNLVRAWRIGDRVGAFSATADGVKVTDASGDTETAVVDANHRLMHHEMELTNVGVVGSMTFTWKGDRLVGVQEKSGKTHIDYDCKKPAHR